MSEIVNTSRIKECLSFEEKVTRGKSGWSQRLWLLWSLLGPGLLAMIGDNDAGGMLSYTVTGATFGISLFLPLVFCLAPITYTVQEMAMRLGVVTQRVYTELLFSRFGRFWGYFSLSALLVANLMTLMTEFIGMTAGLTLLGLSLWASAVSSFLLVVSLALFTGYWTKERLALIVGALNVVFLGVAYLSHPDSAEIVKAFTTWDIPLNAQSIMMWFIIATIGNAVAPWMIFFQSSATIDKGLTVKDLHLGRIDTAIGSIVQPIIAMAAILCGAALFDHLGNPAASNPAEIISALMPVTGQWGSILFGFGLFNAGWLAAITISLSTSWTISGAFGWPRSLDHKLHEAPRFYAIYIGGLLISAIAVLLPGLSLTFISVLTQVVAGILLIPILIFLILLTNNCKLMGEYVNGCYQQLWSWTIVAILIAMTLGTVWQAVAG
jgi:Mn2+/Fe2+ NRAMP family transporter